MSIKNEEAVSPVIGNMTTNKVVAATATQQDSSIIVTYQGGASNSELSYLMFNVEGSTIVYTKDKKGETTSAITASDTSGWSVPVGSSWTFPGGTPNKNHVVVSGHFKDGSSQVILDTFV